MVAAGGLARASGARVPKMSDEAHAQRAEDRGPANTSGPSRRAGRHLACELRDDGAAGVELQVYRDRELLYRRRWANRALALAEADERKAQYLREGGVLLT